MRKNSVPSSCVYNKDGQESCKVDDLFEHALKKHFGTKSFISISYRGPEGFNKLNLFTLSAVQNFMNIY